MGVSRMQLLRGERRAIKQGLSKRAASHGVNEFGKYLLIDLNPSNVTYVTWIARRTLAAIVPGFTL